MRFVTKKTEKACSRCKEIKPISEFYHCFKAKDGLSSWCKVCYNRIQAGYREKKRKADAILFEKGYIQQKVRQGKCCILKWAKMWEITE